MRTSYKLLINGIIAGGVIAGTVLSTRAELPPQEIPGYLSPRPGIESSAVKELFLSAGGQSGRYRRPGVSISWVPRAALGAYYQQQVSALLKEIGFSGTYDRSVLRYLLDESKSAMFILLQQEGRLAGISVISDGIDSEEAFIAAVGIQPSLQRQGLGKLLFEDTIRYLRSRGYESFYTELDQAQENMMLERWIREKHASGELFVERQGVAYEFSEKIIFMRGDILPGPRADAVAASV